MSLSANTEYIKTIEEELDKKAPIKLGLNKKNVLIRLIYEISRAKNLSVQDIIRQTKIDQIARSDKGKFFYTAKRTLFKMRYPSMESDEHYRLIPLDLNSTYSDSSSWDFKLAPHVVYIENDVKDLEWTRQFMSNFSDTRCEYVSGIKDVIKDKKQADQAALYEKRRESVFLVKNKSSFTKVCPCSTQCKRCGYWILNIGFGCPVDCTYCYLQLYSNIPGLVLPANIEDYYEFITRFDKKLTQKTRIGTGEFADSLALDAYTNYSSYLIPFFRNTSNLVLELKTKTDNIDNIVKHEPHGNVVISWSLNTRNIEEGYEKGSANITSRIEAARNVAKRGYKIGFHFDPVVYYADWENEYEELINEIFSFNEISRNTVWVSIGTLRYTPGVKRIAEKRFHDMNIFYEGEFFIGKDKKFRYSQELRIDMYTKMAGWIREFSHSCWIYLCMEPSEIWERVGKEAK